MMRRAAKIRRLVSRSTWLFVLTVAGYPIFGLLAAALDVNSVVMSMPFRIGVAVLALLLLRRAPSVSAWWNQQPWLIAFWLLYLVRLIWDMAVAGVAGVPEALTFFLATVLLPSVALGLNASAHDNRHAARVLLAVGGAACGLAVLMHTLGWGQASSLSDITDRLFFEALNPISLGHAATSTLIAALCIMFDRPGKATWVLTVSAATVAGVCLMLAGSRGPVIALAVCGILFAAGNSRWGWLALMLLFLLALTLPQTTELDTELWRRFTTISEDDSALERLLLQGNAIQQFLANPILGSAFVELESLSYPHNIVIESGMALGVVGIGLFITCILQAAQAAARQFRCGNLLLPLLFAQYFVAAQFSGGIWGASALWACTALLLGLKLPHRRTRDLGQQRSARLQHHPDVDHRIAGLVSKAQTNLRETPASS